MTEAVGFSCVLQNPANYFVAALYDLSNISVVLESQQIPKGSGYPTPPDTFSVTFLTALQQNKLYRVILWESADTTPTGISRASGDTKASLNSITLRGALFLTGGETAGMNVGASGYVDPTSSLAGWNYDLELFGSGTLTPGTNYTVDPTTGNWTLIDGTTIQQGQLYIVHFQAQVSAAPQPPVSLISSGQILTASQTLTAAMKNQALYAQATATSIILGLPALSSGIADYDQFIFYCNGGNQINTVIQTAGTDKIQYRVGDVIQQTQLVLGINETLKLVKANGVWNVDNGPLVGVDKVGEIFYKLSKSEFNYVLANGVLLSRTLYPRLFAYAQTLEADAIVSEAAWIASTSLDGIIYYPNAACWTMGTDGTNFRIPQLVNMFLRGADGVTRTPSSQQQDAMIKHSHSTAVGLLPGAPFGKGPTSTNGAKYGNPQSGQPDLTDVPYNVPGAGVNGTAIQRVSTEVRPVNIGAYALIRI